MLHASVESLIDSSNLAKPEKTYVIAILFVQKKKKL